MTVLIYAHSQANPTEIISASSILQKIGLKVIVYGQTQIIELKSKIKIHTDTTQLIQADCLLLPGEINEDDTIAKKIVCYFLKNNLLIAAFQSSTRFTNQTIKRTNKYIQCKQYDFNTFFHLCIQFSILIAEQLGGNTELIAEILLM
ncbi:hypothetical protein SS50377_23131 [Spironucleus salmonicida]|uniref:DJ-1/PfpI family protein n=1 Tax=Spironucleus salmonicida TaxID=348837 RepID=V6LBV9_9EUKA|nr:hypothetical protein SS50377_23131 [Spironucleus salmonicida]|eukprot:EST41693.1 Hypothetical protein SS50377_18781 [Spironucleus salmonicida]